MKDLYGRWAMRLILLLMLVAVDMSIWPSSYVKAGAVGLLLFFA